MNGKRVAGGVVLVAFLALSGLVALGSAVGHGSRQSGEFVADGGARVAVWTAPDAMSEGEARAVLGRFKVPEGQPGVALIYPEGTIEPGRHLRDAGHYFEALGLVELAAYGGWSYRVDVAPDGAREFRAAN